MLAQVVEIHRAFSGHDAAKACEILSRRLPLQEALMEAIPEEQREKMMEAERRFLGDESIEWSKFDAAGAKLVIGKSAVLVHTGFEKDELKKAFIFQYRAGGKQASLKPFVFARSGGKWVVWN